MKSILPLIAVIVLMTACKHKQIKETAEVEELPAAFDLKNIDSTVTPCSNFYQYAIGSWMENNPVPSTESRWASFNILAEANRKKVETILLETSKLTEAQKGSDEQLIRDLYLSANDSVGIEEKGISALKPIFEKIDQIRNAEDFASVLGYLKTIGVGGPLSIYVRSDRKNSAENLAGASQSGLSLPDREYYLSNEDKFANHRANYLEHMSKMFNLAGLTNVSPADVLSIEMDLAEIQWSRTELREPEKTYNKMPLSQFVGIMGNLPIDVMIDKMGFADFDSINVGQPSYFKALNSYLAKTGIEKWKSYLTWKTLMSYGSRAGGELEQESFDFFSAKLHGVKEMRPRSERVLRLVDGRLGEPLGKLFANRHFAPESKEYMSKMIENLRDAYRVSIDNLEWMGDTTKKKALRKLESFTYKIGYPDKWRDYSSLEITPDNLIQNLINISQHRFEMMADKLGKPVDRTEWHMNPQTVNAYYNSSNNEVVFPAGILQPPFYHPTFDDAINYGGIGAVIGHEFTHGFDDKGSKSDWNGNLNNWWTDEDRSKFEKLTTALAEQYSGYEALPNMHVKGEMTLGENIADLGGLTLAYAALEKELEGIEVPQIDGFNWEQRFFLGWANIWKQTITEDELRSRLLSDYHSPGEFRVLGPLANLPQFEKAFNCTGQPMVKPDSAMIRIW